MRYYVIIWHRLLQTACVDVYVVCTHSKFHDADAQQLSMVIYALHKINFTETESKTAGLTSLFDLVIGSEKPSVGEICDEKSHTVLD